MAQITTLKDKEGKILYPITSSKAVFDENNIDLETKLNNKVEKEQGKGLSSNDFTDTEKQKLDNLPTSEALTTQINGKQSTLQDSEDVTISNNQLSLTERAKLNELIAQWKAATRIYVGPTNSTEQLGDFDENRGLFTYAGRITLTEPEVRDALTYDMSGTSGFYNSHWWLNATVPLHVQHGSSMDSAFSGCRRLKIAAIFDYYDTVYPSNIGKAFNACTNLKYIVGTPFTFASISTPIENTFANCANLEEVWIRQLKTSINFKWSKNLRLDCIAYMITNAANTSAITITVHPDVYAKLTGDTSNDAYNNLTDEEKQQWTALIEQAAAKDIQFATA